MGVRHRTPLWKSAGPYRKPARSEPKVWVRGVIGVVFCLVGAVWVAQGTGAMHGSSMSGHGQYAALGVVTILLGVAVLLWAYSARRRRGGEAS